MWRPAVLVGRSLTDLLTAVICTAFVVGTGLLVGWRPERSPLYTLAGFALFWLFSYALSWGCACLGIVSKGPESAQGVGLVILFPLAIVSNALVPTAHMPAALRAVANWNPVSAVTATPIPRRWYRHGPCNTPSRPHSCGRSFCSRYLRRSPLFCTVAARRVDS